MRNDFNIFLFNTHVNFTNVKFQNEIIYLHSDITNISKMNTYQNINITEYGPEK